MIIVWSLVLIDLSTASVRCGATVQKCRKILVKTSGDTSDNCGFTRFFFLGLGNLFSHKSIGKLLICEMMVRRTVFVRLLSSKLLLWVYNIITTMASTASIWPVSESFYFDASLPCRLPLRMTKNMLINCKSIFLFIIIKSSFGL